MLEKRVAIFMYEEWLSLAPSILSTIRILTEHGYWVDIFHLCDESVEQFKAESPKVTSIQVPSGKSHTLTLLQFFGVSLKRVMGRHYAFFIGVDQEGIVAAGILSIVKRVPTVYYSLEILTKEDIVKEEGLLKVFLSARRLLEGYYARKAQSTIVQDKYRAEVLIQDLGIARERIALVPNSYEFDTTKVKENPALDALIPYDKKVVIYAGSIIPDMAIEELVSSIAYWPQDTVLILHTPYQTPYVEEIKKLIKRKNLEERVIISVKKLPVEELFYVFSKAHIGVSLYRFSNKSFELATSGKLHMYLNAGLPFISSRIPYVEDFISKYHCGICVDQPEEIGKAIQEILQNYSEFSQQTKKCFEEELDFSKHFQKVLQQYEKQS